MKYKLIHENITENYAENILKLRGVEDVKKFLKPTEENLQTFKDLNNINKMTEIINNTINDNKPYALIVDCDCDGYTSSAILYQFIKELNPNKEIKYFLHEGKQHGLQDKWEELLDTEWSAILIPDAGSNDSEYAKNFNCPILIMDHHILESEETVDNMIIVNNQISDNYKNKNLSGAGVTWQVCRAINTDIADKYIDLAALGICGDMMSGLEIENQYIWTKGFNNIKNIFFNYICDKQAYSMGNKINPTTVAFYVVPYINAMVRMGSMEEKERLFLAFIDPLKEVDCHKRGAKGTKEKVYIESFRECVNAKSHQDKQKKDSSDSLEIKISNNELLNNKILFIRLDDEDDFPSEMNGLIAMQLSQKYNRPTIVARLNEEGYIRGSARGNEQSAIPNFKEFLNESGLFEYTMGHNNAFGISIKNSDLDKLHNYANTKLEGIDIGENIYYVDIVREATDKDIKDIIFNLANYENIWSQKNDTPKIVVSNINISSNDIRIMGQNKDTIGFEKNGISYIKFTSKELGEKLKKFDYLNITIVGEAQINEYKGTETPQIKIKDINFCDGSLIF